jgi:uncharacterized membrane protein HdeD (DUF308 family)
MENEAKSSGSLASRVLCKELLILLVGLVILGSGFYTGEAMQYFWGGTIITGAVALYFVRKKDWKQHWEEQERLARALEERRRRQKEEGK